MGGFLLLEARSYRSWIFERGVGNPNCRMKDRYNTPHSTLVVPSAKSTPIQAVSNTG
jgi:hypothetical protein